MSKRLGFVLSLALLAFASVPAYALTEAYGTFECMGIVADVPAGYTAADIGQVRVYKDEGGVWKRQQDAVQVGSGALFASSVFGLVPNTSYTFRVEFYNTSVVLIDTQTVTGSTRADITIPAPAAEVFVSPAGNDGGTGAIGDPFATVGHAIAVAAPGTAINLRAGTYYEGELYPTVSGTSAAPIVIRAYNGETAILDGADPALISATWTAVQPQVYSHAFAMTPCWNVCLRRKSDGTVFRSFPMATVAEVTTQTSAGHTFAELNIDTAYCADGANITVLVPGGTIADYDVYVSRYSTGLYLEGRDFIYVDGITLTHFGGGAFGRGVYVLNSNDILVQRCRFLYNNSGVMFKDASSRLVVQDNVCIDDTADWQFTYCKSEALTYSDQVETGLVLATGTYSGRGMVVRRNSITGTFDGSEIDPYVAYTGTRTLETDFYDNTMHHIFDDFCELDGYARNVRFFGNYMRGSLSGISLAQALDGPTWIIRNAILDYGTSTASTNPSDYAWEGYPFKTNGGPHPEIGSGPTFFYHNTSYTSDPRWSAILVKSNVLWKKFTFRNNIWVGQATGMEHWSGALSPWDWDYDDLYTYTGPCMSISGTDYNTLADAQAATGYLPNGISAEPQFINAVAGDYHVNKASPCVDRGVVLAGINENYSGAAPDIGAYETGATGNIYWVAMDGDDANDGSETHPWRTVQHAVDTTVAGDTIIVKPGTYVGAHVNNSGAAAAPKTLMSQYQWQAVLNAKPAGAWHNGILELEGDGYWVFDGFEVDGQTRTLRCVDIRVANHVTVRNCHVHHAQYTGIFDGFADYATYENNVSHDNGEHGIYHSNSADYAVIRGNTSYANTSCGIHMNGDASMGGDGVISFCTVEKNICYDNPSGSAINCDGVSDSLFRNNLLYNNRGSGMSLYGGDSAEASSRDRVLNNTIVMPTDGRWAFNMPQASGIPSPTNNKVFNNILFNARADRGSVTTYPSPVGYESDYNVVVDRFTLDDEATVLTFAQWQALGYDAHSLLASSATDLFVDPAASDYHLKSGSAAIEKGTTLADVTEDIAGLSRPRGNAYDIGAYEYNDPNDVDNDGLPDGWETANFGNLAQGPGDDPDGDGWTNLQEYSGGSNPMAADAVPPIGMLRPHPRLWMEAGSSDPVVADKATVISRTGSPAYSAIWTGVQGSANVANQALTYLVNGDAAKLSSVKTALSSTTTNAEQLIYGSLAFDWVYDALTPAERATYAANLVASADSIIDSNTYLYGNYGIRYQAAGAIAAMAAAGDADVSVLWPKAYGRMNTVLELTGDGAAPGDMEGRMAYGGGWGEGYDYNRHTQIHMLQYLQALRSAFGTHEDKLSASAWVQGVVKFMIYCVLPDGSYVLPFGDIDWPFLIAHDRATVLLATDAANSPHGQYWLNHVYATDSYWAYTDLIFYDAARAEQSFDTLPKGCYFPGIGLAVFRSGWGTSDTYVAFKSCDYHTYHQNNAQNAFYIYKSAPLAVRTGVYDGNVHDHNVNYLIRTIAQNCVTVFDPTETFSHPDGIADDNDGGQLVQEWTGEHHDLTEWRAQANRVGTPRNTVDWVEYDLGANYGYAAAEAGRAYKAGKAPFASRQLLWLDPDYIVVFDRVTSGDANFQKKFHLHSPEGMTLSDDTAVIETTSAPGTTAPAKLFCKNLLPTAASRALVGGAGNEFFYNGRNHPGPAPYNNQIQGLWRLEESAPLETTTYFLNVMYATPAATASMPPVSVIDETADRVTISINNGQHVVHFDKTGPVAWGFDSPQPLVITTATLPDSTVGAAYSQTLTAAGGIAPYTWSVTAGALATGLSLNASTGEISGTTSAAGTFDFTVQASDSQGVPATATKDFSVTVTATLAVTTASLPNATVGAAYSQTLAAAGGTAPYSWAVTSGALPAGLSLNASSGLVSGTPTSIGTSNFTVTVTDAVLATASQPLQITVDPQTLVITTSTLATGTVGQAYSDALAATGGVAPYTWSVTAGALPAGLVLDAWTGAITGTPTAAGTFNFTAEVSDSQGTPATATKPLSITVNAAGSPSVTTPSLPNGTEGLAYSASLSASGGLAPYKWYISGGTLPKGLALNSSTGEISGVCYAAGSYTFTVKAWDSQSPSAFGARTYTVSVAAADSDGDGLSDGWEMQYFGNLSQGPSGDPDGDGYINLAEMRNGTNPTVAETIAPYLSTVDWISVGPGGGGAQYNPAIAPNNPDLMYGFCDMGGVYRSTDGGHNWRMYTFDQAQMPVAYSPTHCNPAFNPFDEKICFIAISGELKRTTDGGDTWQAVRSGASPTAVAIDRADTQVVFYADNANHMFKSTDGGSTWAEVAAWFSGVNKTVLDIFVDASTPTSNLTVYAATSTGLYKTIDGGATWAAANGDLPSTSISDFNAAMKAGSAVLYVTISGSGVYKSTDGGTTWTAKNTGFDFAAAGHMELGICDSFPDVLYVGSQENSGPTVYKTTDGGDNWTMVLTDPAAGNFPPGVTVARDWMTLSLGWGWGEEAHEIEVSPTNPNYVGFSEDGRTWRSDDGGASWFCANNQETSVGSNWWPSVGFETTTNYRTHFAPWNHDFAYISYTDIGFFRSEDRAASWRHAISGSPFRNTFYDCAFDPTISGKMWAVSSSNHDLPHDKMLRQAAFPTFTGTILRSTDSGATWTNLGHPIAANNGAITSIIVDPTSPAGNRTLYCAIMSKGVYKSTNDGVTWTACNVGLGMPNNMNAWQLRLMPDGTLYCALTLSRQGGGFWPGGLFKSTNAGASWTQVNVSQQMPYICGFDVEPDDQNNIYVATFQMSYNGQQGLYKSSDGGATWTRTLSLGDMYGADVDPELHGRVYTTIEQGEDFWGSGGIFISENRGDTWTKIPGFPFERYGPNYVSFDPDDSQKIYVTTFGGGVFKGVVAHATAPAAAFTATAGPADLEVTFDSSASTGTINTYYWQFGDGATSFAANPVHTYGAPGVYTVTLSVQGPAGTAEVSHDVTAAAMLSITTAGLPAGQVGVAYSGTLTSAGGTAPITWSITAGVLPTGLSLDPATGAITGTPTTAGTFNFSARAADSATGTPQAATKALAILVDPAPLSITTASLANGQVGVAYSAALAATGGTPPYTWSITAGTLPTGLSLDASTGAITGTPTTAETANFTVQVTDFAGVPQTDSKALSITVNPATLAITTVSLPNGQVGVAYSQSVAATGGTLPYTWSVTAGTLPAGLSLDASTGAISGTPTTAETANFTVQVTDSAGVPQTDSKALSIVVDPAVLTITTASLPNGQVGVAYSQTLAATGGTLPYTWLITAGALPAGLSLDGSTGAITGTPTTAETANFTVQVTDSAGVPQIDSKALSITILPVGLVITTASLPGGQVGIAYSQTLGASGGTPPYTWLITAGALPAGLSLDGSTGAITGTPTTVETANLTVQAADSQGVPFTATKDLSIVVLPSALVITTASLPAGVEGQAYSASLAAAGGIAPYTWFVARVDLPEGLRLNVQTGEITGTPFEAGTANVTFQANDSQAFPATVQKAFDIAISAADSDADGLPDGWEMKYFGDLAQGPGGDPDGDGYVNLAEYRNNTNPAVAETLPPYIAGAQWINVGLGGGGAQYSPVIAPGDAGVMFANCDMGGFYRSTDGGRHFRMIDGSVINSVTSYSPDACKPVFTPNDPNTVYVGRSGGLHKSSDGGVTWAKLVGQYDVWSGDWATAIAVDGTDSNYVLTGWNGYNLAAGQFLVESRDAGGTWNVVAGWSAVGQGIREIWIDPTTPPASATIYVSTGSGMYKSTDGGANWAAVNNGLPATDVLDFGGAVKAGSAVLYCTVPASLDGLNHLVGGPYKSTDGGATWQQIKTGLTEEQWGAAVSYGALGVSESNADVVYLGSGENYGPTVYRTTDGGASWQMVLTHPAWHDAMTPATTVEPDWVDAYLDWGWGGDPHQVTVSPTNPNCVAISEDGRTFRSDNGGQHWFPCYTEEVPAASTWYETRGLDVTNVYRYAVDPHDALRHYIANTDIGLSLSEDGGVTWKWSSTGSPWTNTFYDLAFDPEVDGRMWAAVSNHHDAPEWKVIRQNVPTLSGGVVISNDHGQTWAEIGHSGGLPNGMVTSIAIDPTSTAAARRMWVTVMGLGVYETNDGGATWVARNSGLGTADDMNCWMIERYSNGDLFCAVTMALDASLVAHPGGLWKSTDGGLTWAQVNASQMIPWPVSFDVDPTDENVIYVAGFMGSSGLNNGGVWKTTDGGATWSHIVDKPDCWGVRIDPNDRNRVYLGAWSWVEQGEGSFISEDGGTTWTRLVGMPFTSAGAKWTFFDPVDSQNIYIGTDGGGAWKARIVRCTPPVAAFTATPASGGAPLNVTFDSTASTGGINTYAWDLGDGSISYDANPSHGYAADGTYTVTLTVYGPNGQATVSHAVTASTLSITTASLPDGIVGTAYNQALASAGGIAPVTWSITAGALPSGLALDAATGVITGIPTAAGTASFTVEARDSADAVQAVTKDLSIIVNGSGLAVTTVSLPNGQVTVPYAAVLTAAGGTGPYSWAITAGTLPAGLSLDAATGVISGTPTLMGTSNITVQVTDSSALPQSATGDLSILVLPPPLVITTASLPDATQGFAYSQTISAAGGLPPYGWIVIVGALPAGLSLDPGTGTISGTPTTVGTSNFTVQVTDAQAPGWTATKGLSIAVGSGADSDGDGLPDGWEMLNFGNLDQGAYDDPDQDGWYNITEFQRMTDPNVQDLGIPNLGLIKAHPRLWMRPDASNPFVKSLAAVSARISGGYATEWGLVTSSTAVWNAALAYRFTGDPTKLSAVKKVLVTTTSNADTLVERALAYDWVYNGLSVSERAAYAANLVTSGYNVRGGTVGPNNVYTSVGISVERAAAIAALATAGDDSRAQDLFNRAYAALMKWRAITGDGFDMTLAAEHPGRAAHGGGWPEGYDFDRHASRYVLQFNEALRSALEQDFIHNSAYWRDKISYLIHGTTPDQGHLLPWDDNDNVYLHRFDREEMLMLAGELGETHAQYWLNHVDNAQIAYSGCVEFLFRDRLLAETDFSALPGAMYFEGIGLGILRSGWGTTDTLVAFRASDWYSYHQNNAQGAFMIWKTAPLATKSGVYDGVVHDHYANYSIRTVAYNGVTVYQPGEQYFMPGGLASTNDGGQMVQQWSGDPATVEDWRWQASRTGTAPNGLEYTDRDVVDPLGFTSTGQYDYVAAEYGRAYVTGKVPFASRQVMFVKPNWIIVFDRVTSADPTLQKKFMLHSGETLAVNGDEATIGVTTLPGTTAPGKLFMKKLLPAGIALGTVGGAGMEFYYDGANHPYNTAPYGDQVGGKWRLEEAAPLQATSYFLNVFYAADGTVANMPNAELVSETADAVTLSLGDGTTLVTFNKTGAVDYTFTSGGTPVQITTLALAGATQDSPYSAAILTAGGTLPFTWSVTAGSLPAGLTLNPSTGVISGTPTATGTFNFTVQVVDSAAPATSDTQDLSITVAAVNHAPTLSGVPDVSTNEDVPLVHALDLWTYANDQETPVSGLIYTITNVTNPSAGVSLEANQYVNVNPALNWHGTATVTVQVSDGSLTASDSFVVTVNSVNDPPSWSAIPNVTTNEDTPVAHARDLWSYASDVETAVSSLAYSITNVTAAQAGVTISSNRYIDVSPAANWNGTATVTVQVSDGLAVATTTFDVIVNAVNDPPVISGVPDVSTQQDTPLIHAIDCWTYASDPETAASGLTYTILSSTSVQAGVSISGNRYVDVNPAPGWYGTSTVTVQVSDGSLAATDSFVVTVTRIDAPPVVTHTPVATANEGQAVTVTATVTDADDPAPTVKLYYRTVGAATYTSAAMASIGADQYQGTIPAATVLPAGVEYYITGADSTTTVTHGPHVIAVTPTPDTTGPAVSGVATVPTRVFEGVDNSVTLTALADDRTLGNSNITQAEYFIGPDPGQGSGTAMSASDGSFDTPAEGLIATINTSAWTVATSPYVIHLRARDDHGNWGAMATLSVLVVNDTTPPGVVTDLTVVAPPSAQFRPLTAAVADVSSEVAPANAAAMAVDGNAATFWSTAGTAASQPEHITLDLGGHYPVGKITLRPGGVIALFPAYFKVKVTDADVIDASTQWTSVVTQYGYAAVAGPNSWQIETVRARYVRLEAEESVLDGGSGLYFIQIGEFEVDEAVENTNTLLFTWTAPGDDGYAGQATVYDLRYSTAFITSANFSAAASVADEPAPQVAGSVEGYEMKGLAADTVYYVALKAADEAYNWSGISNVAFARTAKRYVEGIVLLAPADETAMPVSAVPTFRWESSRYNAFWIDFSNSPMFPSSPVTLGDGTVIRTQTWAVGNNVYSWKPTNNQWRTVKTLATSTGGTVYWRIHGKSTRQPALGVLYSQTWHTYDIEGGSIHLSFPPDAAQLQITPGPQFAWTYDGSDMARYYVEFSTNSAFQGGSASKIALPTGGTAGLAWTPTAAQWKQIKKLSVSNGGMLYWHVKGVDASGSFFLWSETWTFTVYGGTITLLPPVPNGDGTVDFDGPVPAFRWDYQGSGFYKFFVQFSTNTSFKPVMRGVSTGWLPTGGVTTTSVTLPLSAWNRVKDLDVGPGVPVYWRVKAVDQDGVFSMITPPSSFIWRNTVGLDQYGLAHTPTMTAYEGLDAPVAVSVLRAYRYPLDLFLAWRETPSSAWAQSAMTRVSSLYSGLIPGSAVIPSSIEYLIIVNRGGTNVTLTYMGPYTVDVWPKPIITHTPVTAAAAGSDVTITASFSHPHLNALTMWLLWHRPPGPGPWAGTGYTGANLTWTIPGSAVQPPGVEYMLQVETPPGSDLPWVTSGPFTITVP